MRVIGGLGALLLCAAVGLQESPATPAEVLSQLEREAHALASTVESTAARAVLEAVAQLPAPEARRLYVDPATGRKLSARAVAALPEAGRAELETQELPAEVYYFTKYGSPLAYTRAIELLGQAGIEHWRGRRVLDFGYGGIAHLRLLALCGADAVGVDVDPFLSALYGEEADQGVVAPRASASSARPDAPSGAAAPASGGAAPSTGDAALPTGEPLAASVASEGTAPGRVRLLEGRWPANAALVEAVGSGYDVFLSKNTLKRGYVHPTRAADERHLIDLGVDDATFLAQVHRLLVPGGLVLLYNICPPEAGPDEPFVPWSDGRSPFTRAQWVAAGFELLALDQVDDAAARAQGVLLDWGDATEMEAGIHCWYTLARRLPDQGEEPPSGR